MPLLHRSAIVSLLGISLFCHELASESRGQQVWTGYTESFSHPSNSSIADEISPNVHLTRGTTQGLFNSAAEAAYANDLSPKNTRWATEFNNPGAGIAAANYAALSFTDWRTAYGGASLLATNIIGSNAVVYLPLDNIYLDLRFTGWGSGSSSGGSFAYVRAEGVPEPTTMALLLFCGLMPLAVRRRAATAG
jgi:hypothetical protein